MIVKRNLLDNLGLSFNITFGLYQINNDPGIYQEEWLISGFLMWTSWSGVHADWMEQKRTGYIYNWKNGHIQMRNHAETGTVTGVSIGINRCRGESFYAWFRIFFSWYLLT